ncbi:ATP-binding protein [Streptomyces sp. SID10115]|nr:MULTISPECIES: ATP-binding protein [unclassified Streptomyces]
MNSWRVPLPHTSAAVSIARKVIRAALLHPAAHASQSRQALVDHDVAELLTAELVTNAVEHTTAQAPLELSMEVQHSECRVEVRDHGAAHVEELATYTTPRSKPDQLSESGRGLLLVRELSSSTGCSPQEGGKSVWFTLSSRQS